MFTREEIKNLALAAIGDDVDPRTCQKWTRELVKAGSVGDFDGDGAADAEDGWKAEPSWAKHVGDRNPPAGVPGYWEGGGEDNGHRAWFVGNADLVGVDSPANGKIGRVHIDWVERNWGLRYVGWTETISGIRIPTGNPPTKPKEPRPGTKLGIALEQLRSKLRAAKRNGYPAQIKELEQSIEHLLAAYNKKNK